MSSRLSKERRSRLKQDIKNYPGHVILVEKAKGKKYGTYVMILKKALALKYITKGGYRTIKVL